MKQSLMQEKEVLEWLEKRSEKPYRYSQIKQAVYGDLVKDPQDITTLSKELRESLAGDFVVSTLQLEKVQTSEDGTQKFLFKTQDEKYVESVLMRHKTGRLTLCISSQIGCPVKCVFCSTGTMGFGRNLEAHEILGQVLAVNQFLRAEEGRVRNIVFMGMGEPLLNFDNVLRALQRLNDPKAFGIGIRHLTISTSGIVPKIRALMEQDMLVNLAVSLHAPNDELRTKIMPINNAYPLKDLMAVLDEYTAKTNKRIFYEYVMLKGKNDSIKHAHELGILLKGKMAHVNLIPFNPGGSLEDLQCSSKTVMKTFQETLQKYNIPVTLRYTLGQDIDAACGQLAAKESKAK